MACLWDGSSIQKIIIDIDLELLPSTIQIHYLYTFYMFMELFLLKKSLDLKKIISILPLRFKFFHVYILSHIRIHLDYTPFTEKSLTLSLLCGSYCSVHLQPGACKPSLHNPHLLKSSSNVTLSEHIH